jgi:HK97 family phage prohead protease
MGPEQSTKEAAMTTIITHRAAQTSTTGKITRLFGDNLRQCTGVASSEEPGLDGLSVVTDGIDLSVFRAGPVDGPGNAPILRDHDPGRLIGKAISATKANRQLVVRIQFMGPDESPDADMTYRQIKSGYLSGLSIGFNPIQTEPMYGGVLRIVRATLIEISVCSIPAQSQSLINDRYFSPPLPSPVPSHHSVLATADSYRIYDTRSLAGRRKAAADTAGSWERAEKARRIRREALAKGYFDEPGRRLLAEELREELT